MAILALFLIGAGLSQGCVSPGTARGPLAVSGQLLNTSGEPLTEQAIEFLLPQAYGMRPKDLAAGQAMDFGSPKRLLQLVTDAEGRFEGDLGLQDYAVDVWMFPPRGVVPAAPPPPGLLIRLPGISENNYYACAEKGVCTVMRRDGSKIPIGESRLARGDVSVETAASPKPGTMTEMRILLTVRAE